MTQSKAGLIRTTPLSQNQAQDLKDAIDKALDAYEKNQPIDKDLRGKNLPNFVGGEFTLDSSPALAAHIVSEAVEACNTYATDSGDPPLIETYEAFERMLAFRPTRPLEPIKEPEPHRATLDELKRIAYRNAGKAHKYEKSLRLWHKQSELYRKVHAEYAPASRASYVRYVRDQLIAAYGSESMGGRNPFSAPQKCLVTETSRRRNTMITAAAGQGKSTLLKRLIHFYVTEAAHACVILLDPHGELAHEVGRFKAPNPTSNGDTNDNEDPDEHIPSFEERLVYIDPDPASGFQPVFNPYDVDIPDYDKIIKTADALTSAYERILGGEFTANSQPLLQACNAALLLMENASLDDLARFMIDDIDSETGKAYNAPLRNQALRLLPKTENQYTLLHERFYTQNYQSTKNSIASRLQQLMMYPPLRRFTTGRSTFNLYECIENKKFIVFNLNQTQLGSQAARAMGQFIIAMVQGYAIARYKESVPSYPSIHLVADEAQWFVSDTTREILSEARKYGLHLTLATQFIGQFPESVKEALSNIQIYFAGNTTDGKTVKYNTDRLKDTSPEDIRSTPGFHYHVQTHSSRHPVITRQPQPVNTEISDEAFKIRLEKQYQLYYRPGEPPPSTAELRRQAALQPDPDEDTFETKKENDTALKAHDKPSPLAGQHDNSDDTEEK